MMLSNMMNRCLLAQAACQIRQASGKILEAMDTKLPRITVPQRMIDNLNKSVRRKRLWQLRQTGDRSGAVIIKSKVARLCHHKGQHYRILVNDYLASGHWGQRSSKYEKFTVQPMQGHPAKNLTMNFADLNLHPEVANGLQQLNLHQATGIQCAAIPIILTGKNVVCCSETGSGKTLAYLLPILSNLLSTRSEEGAANNQPFAIILVPTRELVEQVMIMMEDLKKYIKFHPRKFIMGDKCQNHLKEGILIDVIVTTPGILSRILAVKLLDLKQLKHIVIDEADTLLDSSFRYQTTRLISRLNIVSETIESPHESVFTGTQVLFVGATVPVSIEKIMQEIVPEETIENVTTPFLHRWMPHITYNFERLLPSLKAEHLLASLKVRAKSNTPTMVFCNKTGTVIFLMQFLQDNGLNPLAFHAQMTPENRNLSFTSFQEGEGHLLVCTDLASRGLNTLRVKQVINYEFPQVVSDFIHRSGRVGRIGSDSGLCNVMSYICYKKEVRLLWDIEKAIRRNSPFPNVDANVKDQIAEFAEKIEARRSLRRSKAEFMREGKESLEQVKVG